MPAAKKRVSTGWEIKLQRFSGNLPLWFDPRRYPPLQYVGDARPSMMIYEKKQNIGGDLSNYWTSVFVHIVFISCIILQKFGIVSGDSYVAFSFPIFLMLTALLMIKGYITISKIKLSIYITILSMTFLSSLYSAMPSESRVLPFSMASLVLFSILYFIMCVRPTRKFSVERTIPIFIKYGRFVTILGVIQTLLDRFVGVSLSSLGAVLPFLQPVLIEGRFNTNAFISYGETAMRSNGIVMLEPSYFSQLIVLSATAETIYMRRYLFIPIYAIGYALSYSGTGAISFALAALLYPVVNPRRLVYVFAAAVIFLLCLGIGSVALPDTVGYFIGRLGEFQSQNSSAYVRYVAQSIVWSDMSSDGGIITGHGAGSYERLYGSMGISSNPVLKFTFEYGLITAILICLFVMGAVFNKGKALMSLVLFSMYMTAGTTELNPNFIILIIMLGIFTDSGSYSRSSGTKAREQDYVDTGSKRFSGWKTHGAFSSIPS